MNARDVINKRLRIVMSLVYGGGAGFAIGTVGSGLLGHHALLFLALPAFAVTWLTIVGTHLFGIRCPRCRERLTVHVMSEARFSLNPKFRYCPFCGSDLDEPCDAMPAGDALASASSRSPSATPEWRRLSIWLRALGTALFIGAMVGFVAYAESKKPDEELVSAKLNEAETTLGELNYPGAYLGELAILRKVYVVQRRFTSQDGYAQIKQHYTDLLIPSGWAVVEERKLYDWFRDLGGRELTFEKGEFTLTLTDSGEKTDRAKHYFLGVKWNPPTP